ncbi:G patch domain and ankyrin repeat-containing protein 1 [Protopterus annectens]|uniref:G patch domain and ankyrin repeat-containing protein 1 n=1 Tax=Protopterus annectens TaxID=7888 RepID=UPI001CFA6DB1|nr:G patch domain and ankyrin repeat-containing protein 1 [Protopterus annectens]XP_043919256.1 G patch domain and ankyrin repeat-containing protein 1 [Protopterus annectens]XP_043919265.1 G patch domain and ankyrin repeat-containing protein 1 [Protopterus annectens]
MNKVHLITFTPAKEKSDYWQNGEHKKRWRTASKDEKTLKGEDARNFYEGLLASVDEGSSSRACKRKAPQRRTLDSIARQPSGAAPVDAVAAERYGHQMLSCAQTGNLKTLKELIESGKCDINFKDSYYWTAMMCASYAGQTDVVKYLLKQGAAWVGVCESQGRDAVDLAEEAGHTNLVSIFKEWNVAHRVKKESRDKIEEKKHCGVCNIQYQEDTVKQHERSTVHLFNSQKKPAATYYFIPENNVGYQLMVKEGWNRETGLGPDGQGRKFPVKTVLKRDQKGLGFKSDLKPKVTHFDANDDSAVERPKQTLRKERVATVSKREERKKEAKQKAWERDLRTYMNCDL